MTAGRQSGGAGPLRKQDAAAKVTSPGGAAADDGVLTGVPAVLPGENLTPEEAERWAGLRAKAKAPATRDAYGRDVKRWEAWCAARGARPMPPAPHLVGIYLEEHAALRKPDGTFAYAPATLERWTAALSSVTKAAGFLPPGQHPEVQQTLEAIRRVRGARQRQADPLLLEDLRLLCAAIGATATSWRRRVRARRDTALVTAAFAGGYRRSELAAHALADVTWHPSDGLHMRVASSKTDQQARGRAKGLPFGEDPDPLTCPVCAVLHWVEAVNAWDGSGQAGLMRLLIAPGPAGHVCRTPPDLPATGAPLFRRLGRSGTLAEGPGGMPLPLSGHAVNDIIRHWCREAGLDPERDLTAHSMRAGFVTEALGAGASAREVARQTFHESDRQVYAYQRLNSPLAGNAVTRIRF